MGRHGESSPPSMMEVGVLILLILGFEQLSAAPPAVFDDYFEQDVKAVHLTQRGVIKACLPENKWTQLLAKFEAANTACEVGNENARFDWATLAKLNQGGDGDGNGVEFNLESAEGCLYRQLGWTDGTKLKAKNVKEDFTGLPSNIWNRLEVDLKECYNWNGEFQKKKKRKKREVGDVEDVEELEDVGDVEDTGEAGEAGEGGEEVEEADASNLLNWAKELFPWGSAGSAEGGLRRRKRASIKGKEKKTKGKKWKGKKSGKKKGKKSGTKKKKESKKEKSGSKSSEKSGGSGREKEVYNQLWCADLAVEKALRRCAMQKIRGEE